MRNSREYIENAYVPHTISLCHQYHQWRDEELIRWRKVGTHHVLQHRLAYPRHELGKEYHEKDDQGEGRHCCRMNR